MSRIEGAGDICWRRARHTQSSRADDDDDDESSIYQTRNKAY